MDCQNVHYKWIIIAWNALKKIFKSLVDQDFNETCTFKSLLYILIYFY